MKVANHVLTVKATKGNFDLKLDGKTEFTKNDPKAQLADLTPGARVVVDIAEGSKDKLAHAVKMEHPAKPSFSTHAIRTNGKSCSPLTTGHLLSSQTTRGYAGRSIRRETLSTAEGSSY